MRRFVPAALVALTLFTTPVLAQDDDGGGFLENLIEDNLSGAGREVQITGFQGALSSQASLDSLTIADDEGIWLTLRDVVLDWNRSALLRGRLQVNALTAGEIIVPRLPAADPEAPTPEATPFSLPELPVSINIEEIAAERVELGEALFGAAAVVSLNGSVSLDGGAGAAEISVARVDGREGALTLDASYDNASEDLAIQLNLTEEAGGIAATLLSLPGTPSVVLDVDGTGPLSDFVADITLDTDGARRLAGTVELTADGEGTALTRGFRAEIGGDIAPVIAPEFRPFFGPDIGLIAQGTTRPEGGFDLTQLDLSARALSLSGQVRIGANGLPDLIDVTGSIADETGQPVRLPLGGAPQVDRLDLAVQFDASQSEDWTAEVTLDGLDTPGLAAQRIVLDGRGVIQDTGGTMAVTANLDFDASGLSAEDPAVAQALGDGASGVVALNWSQGAPLVLEQLDVTGNAFELTGSGEVRFEEGTQVTLSTTLQAADLAAFSGLAGRSLSGAAALDLEVETQPLDGAFDITLSGTTTDLAVDQAQADALLAGQTTLNLNAVRDTTGTRLEELRLSNAALDVTASGTLSSTDADLNATVALRDAAILDPGLSGPANVTATAGLSDGTWTYDVNGTGVGAEITATGTISELEGDSPRITTQAEAEIADLAPFSGLAQRDLAGGASVQLEGFVLADLTRADMTIDATTRGVETGEARFDDLLIGRTDLSAQVQRDGERVTIQRFSLNGAGTGLRAEGAGQIDGLTSATPEVSGMVDASVARLSLFSALAQRRLSGSVDATVTGSARLDASQVDADITLNGRDVSTGMADIDPLLTGAFALSGQVSRQGGSARIDGMDLSAASMGLRLTGDASVEGIDTDAPLVALDAALVADTIAPLSGLAQRNLAGAVDLTVEGQARADLSVLDVEVAGQTRNLAVGQDNADRLLEGVTTLDIAALREGEAIRLPRFRLSNDQITATADGQYLAGQSALRADIAIADLRDLEPRMRGAAQLNLFAEEVGELWQVTLDAAAADATLTARADVSDALSGNPGIDGQATLNASDLSRFAPLVGRPVSGGVTAEITGSGQADLSRFDIVADVEADRLAIGQTDADRLLNGQTDLRLVASRAGANTPIEVETFRLDAPGASATANGTVLGSDANLTVSARLGDLGGFVPGLNGPVSAQGQVRSSGQTLNVDLSGTGPGGITLNADGTVQQDFSRANLSLTGRAPLELANSFIQPRALSGTVAFDVAVNGPLALSSVSGRVSTQGAQFVAPNLSLVLQNIALSADISQGTARLNVQADKQAGGRLTGTGPITLSGGYDADLTVNTVGFVVEDPRLYRALLNGTVRVQGPLTGGARISGLLDLVETELRIPSTGLGATGPIPDGLVHINEPAAVRATRDRAGMIAEPGSGGGGGTARPYPLDLTIRATNQIFIRGRGLDAEMGGALTLQGTTQNIIPAGEFNLIRGRLDLLGQRLDLDEGRVSLQGDFTPFIRLVASTDTGDVVVLIIVEGSALAPEISFQSQPELPEEEVLARLLFGKSVTSISAIQAAQLASAVATLAGRGGDGVVARLRQSTGLDDLDITTDEDGNAGVRAGKYLSENLYTDVTVGASGEAEINLNLDLSPSITIKGGANNDGETSLGIYFERDY